LASEPARSDNLFGEIVSVDSTTKTIAVRAKEPTGTEKDGQRMSLEVDEATKILKNGESIKLTELNSGDQVMVSYRTDGNTRTAISITVQTSTG
jgi:hypothetical protein